MEYNILEIHDLGLKLWRGENTLHSSPGYALLEGKKLVFGEQAKKLARIQPQNINNQFWLKLGTEPLDQAFGKMRHCADIAHEHLLHLAQQIDWAGDVVLAVPSNYSTAQLSLLAGIIGQSPYQVVGLVDNTLAKGLPDLGGTQATYLDIQLHSISVDNFELCDGFWCRRKTLALANCGWLALQEKLCTGIANAFIDQTRFDPLSSASSEQLLYDQLPLHLEQLQSSAMINIELGEHTARIDRETLGASCQNIYQKIKQASPSSGSTLYGSTRLSVLPGFVQEFSGLHAVCDNNLARTIRDNEQLILSSPQNLSLTSKFPAGDKAAAITENSEDTATHILHGHKAYPLRQNNTWLGNPSLCSSPCIKLETDSAIALKYNSAELQLQEAKNCQPTVNGSIAVEKNRLVAGDLIEWDDMQIRLIKVTDGDGP